MRGTRAQRALELLATATRGPGFTGHGAAVQRAEARRQYRLWASTWIVPELIRLIPELRGTKIPAITDGE